MSTDFLEKLHSYSWLGNIRELKNVLERALLLSRGAVLRPEHFSGLGSEHHPRVIHRLPTVQDVEESHIMNVMEQVGGNVEKAAKTLNLSRATLYRRLKQIRKKAE